MRVEKVLLVEDEAGQRETLSSALTDEGFECVAVENGTEALDHLQRVPFGAVVTDIRLPGMTGFELLEHIHALPGSPAVVVITGYGSEETAITALRMGADDYLKKPISLDRFVAAVRHAIEKRHAAITAQDYQHTLQRELRQKTHEIEMMFLSMVKSLAITIEARDRFTINHSKAVSQGATTIGKMLLLSQDELKDLQLAGLLHDIGKVGVRDAILTKTGSLTPEEFEEVKTHPAIGERIIKPVARFRNIAREIRHHHERYDGTGYPDGLSGNDIPLGARILAVADCYDALVSARSHRGPHSVQAAIDIIEEGAGTQFDPEVVSVFLERSRVFGVERAKVLVADDDSTIREFFAEALSREGYQVILAKDGVEAVSKAEAERPALAILDARMPQMDGFEALREMRKTYPGLPIILCSGFSDFASGSGLLSLDVPFLTKPIDLAVLIAEVRKAISKENG